MAGFVRWIKGFVRELRRRRVIRVAVVYAGTGFVILEAADILQPALRLPSWTVRLIAVLLILGFPLAVGLAWVYNITEEGLVQAEAEGNRAEIGPGGKPFTSNWILIGLVVVAIGLLLYPRLFSSGEKASVHASAPDTMQIDERSIAVLPFEPLSSGEKTETFARGVHDDLLTRLSNISDLKVISRTSVEKYRNTDLSLPAIADSLGVRWVMEGGVLESGGQIQVNAQLIDPRDDVHVWANDYQRKLTAENLFAIQGEITREIADALKAKLTAGEQKRIAGAPTQNLRAYRLYVQGRQLLASRKPDSIRRAQRSFKRALGQDSTYALAWVGLADARVLYANYGSAPGERVDSIRAVIPEAEAAARRALQLDPDLAEAHASLGHTYVYDTSFQLRKYSKKPGLGKGPEALRHLGRAVELKPSYAEAQHWFGTTLLFLGRSDPALEHLRLAVEMSPDHKSATEFLTWALIANGKYEEAFGEARRLERMYPETGRRLQALALLHLKRWGPLREHARNRRSETEDPPAWTVLYTGLSDAAVGDTSSARRRIEELQSQGDKMDAALIHAALGEVDAAFQAWPETRGWAPWGFRYFCPDLLSAFRADPRYESLIRNLNQAWGLNPDGRLPEHTETATHLQSDA